VAVGVTLADDEFVPARRAVVACVPAPTLYGRMIPLHDLPARVRWGMRRFAWDPATIKVDWALRTPVPWDPAPPTAPGTVHLAHSVEELDAYARQLRANAVPAEPFVLMGQMTTSDPSRSPAGTEALWAYTHVPQATTADAGLGGIRGIWDAADCERMADRMQRRIERFAPGFTDRVISRRILGPHDLEKRNAGLRQGAVGGGTARLRQELFLRPVPGTGRSRTPIRRLFLGSSSAHPGGGVHGAPGAHAARAALCQRT
jgi:phytoene dehydrogenase-like protein